MEFILAQLSMLMWLSLISFILAEFPVQQLKILISGGTGSAVFFFFFSFSFFVPKRQQQYCMSFEFMQSVSSNSTHSEQPWQISLNALLTPYPLCALAQTNTRTRKKKKKNASPFFSVLAHSFPFFFFLAITQWQRTRGEESALICQSEQPFHRASLRSASVPERELLISPGRLACSRLLGSPR